MKYLKRFNEELTPGWLKDKVSKVAASKGDNFENTPQEDRILAYADKLEKEKDPEYVKAEQEKKQAEEKRKKMIEAYPIFARGTRLKIYIAILERWTDNSYMNLEYVPLNFWAKAHVDTKKIELSLNEGQLCFDASFNEKGIEFSSIRNFIMEEKDSYWIKDVLRLIDSDDEKAQISIVGFEDRSELNTLSKIVKEFYPNSGVSATNFGISIDGETKKAGICNKDFYKESGKYMDMSEEPEYSEYEMKQAVDFANRHAVPSLNFQEKMKEIKSDTTK